jgi:molecular chaperone HtpG
MAAEQLEFKAELKELLQLITHSLYSDRDIFLRELISNASDAINKVKFDSLDNDEKLEGNKDWKIKLTPNKDANTLTISDNGIGMDRAQIVDLLGTVAKSGTKAFVANAKAKSETGQQPGLIGQFGVGFYSGFMVADKITVHSRTVGSPADGVVWESDGQGTYTVEAKEKATRGTDVTLHLKDDAKDYLDGYKLRSLVKKFSDFLEHPVVMDEENEAEDGTKTTEETTLNTRKAIWLRTARDVTSEEYTEFYKSLTYANEDPLKTLHFATEGQNEFKALLFIPAKKPYSFEYEEPKAGLKLYIQRVLIMERCEELLPLYLRFVKGVVDSSDLPLNVSREILQNNRQLENIKKTVVRNILDGLGGVKNTKPEAYAEFFAELGPVLKEGLTRDFENKEKIADLCLFTSVTTERGKTITLAEYVAKMPEGQDAIYTLSGETEQQLRNSPFLEAFTAKGYDVLLLTDPIDEFAIPALREYKGKKFQAIDRTDTKLNTDDIPTDVAEAFAPVLTYLKTVLIDAADVKLTNRLTTTASCLVADAHAMNAQMERLMKRWGQETDGAKRTLELNPNNPAVVALKDIYAANSSDPRLESYARLLYDAAVIAEGSKVMDAAGFSKRISDLIAGK